MTAILLAILCFQTGHTALAILSVVWAVVKIVGNIIKELED